MRVILLGPKAFAEVLFCAIAQNGDDDGFASGGFGSSRLLSGPFTFTDGPNGQRIDGRLACHVQGKEIRVDVDVDGLPMRAA